MKIVADESVDKQIVERLRDDGHDVLYVAELDPGIGDELLVRLAGLTPGLKAELVADAFYKHAEKFSTGFAVLSKRSLRLRKPLL